MTDKTKTQTAPATWQQILEDAVNVPGTISKAFQMFHNYSIGNQMLALWQCSAKGIEPGPIGTFKAWKEKGRFVMKGQKAISLCQPVKRTFTVDKTDESGSVVMGADGKPEKTKVQFSQFIYPSRWFVMSQTDGKEVEPEEVPGWDRSKALTGLNISEESFNMPDGNTGGYAYKRTISVNPLHPHQTRIALHELAHVVLGHTEERLTDALSGNATPRNIREVEAETTALIVSEALGLEGSEESRGYIQNWLRGGKDIPEKSAQRIFKAANEILTAGKV